MPRPSPVTVSLTITSDHLLDIDAAAALRRDLTQAAIHYGIAPDEEPDYLLARGAVLFGRDVIDGQSVTTWAREDVDARQVARVAGSLVRTWERIAETHAPGCEAVPGGALVIGRGEQRNAA